MHCPTPKPVGIQGLGRPLCVPSTESPIHSPGSPGVPLSESLPRGAHGEGLAESPLLGGAGEEEEEEAEFDESQLSRSQAR